MARAGDAIENPASGQRLTFLKTASETGGDLLEMESLYTKPTPSRPPLHYHPLQRERFEVVAGELHVVISGRERTLREGEVLEVPPNTPHTMWAEEEGVRVNWRTRPALKTEEFFQALFGLAREGKTNEEGAPNPLRFAAVAREHEDEFHLARPPWPVQRVVFAALVAVGRLLGRRSGVPSEGVAGQVRS